MGLGLYVNIYIGNMNTEKQVNFLYEEYLSKTWNWQIYRKVPNGLIAMSLSLIDIWKKLNFTIPIKWN